MYLSRTLQIRTPLVSDAGTDTHSLSINASASASSSSSSSQIYQVLANNAIILLKKGHVCLELIKHVGTEYLLLNIRAKAIDKGVIVDSKSNYLDINKHLAWLNRKDESTTIFHLDAAIVTIPHKAQTITLGYIEVKLSDFQVNPELEFLDLIRLETFARHFMQYQKAIPLV
ncbi:hypothetical protein J3Q64DRAFT_1842046 [Phycomyces blakesleeanus]|uniref:Uncharacterized protein n=2 Tax=Phycomyces blakesleeanus TaxID=4837 RepID=A0A162NIQ7_PHYB8|nr:hypothetical protein PHYBLDRAFT_149208 [Phycomyces blakesleeanus NRRL 1555(-)]OAD70044.1 hypothetical protein PHYBLDRAFT_149208 [Phycomyces blakesleeanus NRRL 1555(-)]|eukprot:XP_018288084.1 hypothetical protein PHYBLDRAFT_149208 [Phycomyces blakesleeanus NRRL 1555(-)]